jgi:ribosome-associated protein
MDHLRESLFKEVTFKTSRSGGKGGQHVNKVSSKVELNFDIKASSLFSEDQKTRLLEKLAHKINAGGILQLITEEDRSQWINKRRSVDKLLVLLKAALYQPKKRMATHPGKGAIEKRLKAKQMKAIKKINRRSDHWD